MSCLLTTTVPEHIPVRLDSPKNTMPPAVVIDEVEKLRAKANVIIEERNALLKQMDPWFSKVADFLPIMKRKSVTTFTPKSTGSVPNRLCKLKEKTHTCLILTLPSRRIHPYRTLKKSLGLVVDTRTFGDIRQ